MPESLKFSLDPALWGRRMQLGLWLGCALIVLLMVLDWLGNVIQIFFPFATGLPKAAPFIALKSLSVKATPYEHFESAFRRRNLFRPESQGSVSRFSNLQAELTHFELAGILVGRERQVIFRDRQTKQSLTVKEGGWVGNLRVKEIRGRSVVVVAGTEEKEIFIEE